MRNKLMDANTGQIKAAIFNYYLICLLHVSTTDYLLIKCSCKFTFVQLFVNVCTLTPFTITPLDLISQCTCLVILSRILPWPGSIQSHETRHEGYLLFI